GGVDEEGIAVSFDFGDQLPPAYVDKTQIQQVVFNLVCNAIEALKESEKKSIGIKTFLAPSQMVEVQIQDTGPGVDPELQDKIFQPRFSTKSGGMGMGLS